MNSTYTAGINTHRKLIDIPDNVFSALNIRAAAMGTSLKKLIEDILVREVDEMDDAIIYKYLVATKPEGKVMLSDKEQEEFEKTMGIGKFR